MDFNYNQIMRFLKSLIVKKWEIWGYNMDIQGIYNGDLLWYYINGAGDSPPAR